MKFRFYQHILCFASLYFIVPFFSTLQAQIQTDTIRINTPSLEKIFLDNNLLILAEELNIAQAEAHILQAKVWPNPNFSISDIQLYINSTNTETPPLFGNFWRNRTFSAQIQQLIQTAGKRKKQIQLEKQNKEAAKSSFIDMLRSLKAEFRQSCAELLFSQRLLADIKIQQEEIFNLLKANQSQFLQGNISQTELYRLKSLVITIQSEANLLAEQISSTQSQLKTLLGSPPTVYLLLTDSISEKHLKQTLPSLQQMVEIALQQNGALQFIRNTKEVNESRLAIERANRIPDINLGLGYDRNGSVELNFLGASASFDIPLFNRNRGNIKSAMLEVKKTDLLVQNKEHEISNNVIKNWNDLNKAIMLYQSIDIDYLSKLNTLSTAVIRNYRQRNLSLVEFIDYFNSFKDSRRNYYDAIKNITLKKEELNYLAGTDY
ncbi:MAG: TolC family protein [Bacteroidetes bacterium]|nr:TolC family protein [Bacteroidota bacterium]MBS1739491.1 TolC family protein [Bacteroidota bacterium]